MNSSWNDVSLFSQSIWNTIKSTRFRSGSSPEHKYWPSWIWRRISWLPYLSVRDRYCAAPFIAPHKNQLETSEFANKMLSFSTQYSRNIAGISHSSSSEFAETSGGPWAENELYELFLNCDRRSTEICLLTFHKKDISYVPRWFDPNSAGYFRAGGSSWAVLDRREVLNGKNF